METGKEKEKSGDSHYVSVHGHSGISGFLHHTGDVSVYWRKTAAGRLYLCRIRTSGIFPAAAGMIF